MLTLCATSGTANAWYYPPLQNLCRAGSLPDYMRDVDFSPDGSWSSARVAEMPPQVAVPIPFRWPATGGWAGPCPTGAAGSSSHDGDTSASRRSCDPRRRRRGHPAPAAAPRAFYVRCHRAAGAVRPAHAAPAGPGDPARSAATRHRRHAHEATLRDATCPWRSPRPATWPTSSGVTVASGPASRASGSAEPPSATRWMPYVFSTLRRRHGFLHDGARATPKVR